MFSKVLTSVPKATRAYSSNAQTFKLEKDFGSLVFSERVMASRVSPAIFSKYKEIIDKKLPMTSDVADAIAHSMKEWAMEHGATHFTHWFQPLTGLTAEKHDSFIKPTGNAAIITQFKGKALIGAEPDASSFPSGGLRETHCARGYTCWDPQTPAFIMKEGGDPTLCIPAVFYSWKGHALDRKIPLLRSELAVDRAGKRLFKVIGEEGHHQFWSDSGVEQEFFLIDNSQWYQRPDVRVSGRTLQGASATKDQELSDHYFGPLPKRALECIAEIERAAWKLGIPVTTRHQEVAPNQFEISPIFSRASIASDYNMLLMEIMQRVAPLHGFACLLHEKPFKGINGSGKHNNWSIGTNKIPTLMEPGDKPIENRIFLLTLAAVVRGVDVYQDLMRYAIAGAGNDHRLGGHEAPPAIISVYLGDELGALVDAILAGKQPPQPVDPNVDLGVSYLPKHPRDTTDRNRTSPFAFTGNKFEVRCVGSSQRPAVSNFILNSLSADSFDYLSEELEKEIAKGTSVDKAIHKVVKETLEKHKRIIFQGNGYSAEWQKEAEKRGLKNYRTTPEVLSEVYNDKNVNLFTKHKVLTAEEFAANVTVDQETYVKVTNVEAQSLRALTNRWIVPAVVRYQTELLNLGERAPAGRLDKITGLTNEAVKLADALGDATSKLADISDPKEATFFARDTVIAGSKKLRSVLDELETLVDQKHWPLPTYEEILHERPTTDLSLAAKN
eukprot:TRINITY_DN9540_c0_g1_i1.p1 TRINITY_DN9540_c0_g1~~TRINITY_DN9540_c0_g1_i1.p1  ORF type:complete len:726 (+),score=203.99 TRINITY_DN9540_c0_g1_i1:58-2235(+)